MLFLLWQNIIQSYEYVEKPLIKCSFKSGLPILMPSLTNVCEDEIQQREYRLFNDAV
jgi:hypothetical protein